MANNNSTKQYVKMNPREHVLARPGMYIGSIQMDTMEMWVLNNDHSGMCKRDISYVPGLFKIFDEIVVNILDHMVRLKTEHTNANNNGLKIKMVKEIRVNINANSITITNDGEGVDIYKHEVHDIYIPELIFGNMLTSTNYDDNDDRIIGGQNGIGAKACNIYSKKFMIETVDSRRKLLYTQEFSENMSTVGAPKIIKYTRYPYTKITFEPDFQRFGVQELTQDMQQIYVKRVHDINGISAGNIKVYLNDELLPVRNIEKYVDMYIGSRIEHPRVYDTTTNERWQIAISYSDVGYQHISYVNGICTIRGGKHVEYITNQITKKLAELINKKKKGLCVKPQHIKEYLFVFINCTIVNPTFDSQTKETLTTPTSKFGSKYEVDVKFIEKLYKTGIVEKAINLSSINIDKDTKKTDGRKKSTIRGINKLDDANWAGTTKSSLCTLILTEGDSAKTMALSGLSEVGRNAYGIFPLRGKVMNVKDSTQKKINDNEEISNLKKILGLEANKVYTNVSELRYGKIMIMTDSDVDGSHIKGLLFNLFHSMWPSLIHSTGFLNSMLTPIVKAKKASTVKEFYCLTEYEDWKHSVPNINSWEIKYYKGLGTSTNKEAKDYFKNMKYVTYAWEDSSNENIDMAFNKKRSDDRKSWIYNYDRKSILDSSDKIVKYSDFIHKELVHFSVYNLERSIPNIADGLKRSLRKILYCCFKRRLHKEIKVAQLAGYVSEHGAYHHGEVSLQDAIIGMAQDFVGSNNINLLLPNGQFGTRVQGGKDSASSRYIHTQLNAPLIYSLFNEDDNAVLEYLDDDGVQIEPEYYVPVLPMILINGSNGIGTGFSTNIPCYNPRDIIANIKGLLRDEDYELQDMQPWYKGFTGRIDGNMSYGIYRRKDKTRIEVNELPIGYWTEDFKSHIEQYIDKHPKILKDYESHYTDKCVHFVLQFQSKEVTDSMFDTPDNQTLTRFEIDFKMTSTRPLSTTNMHLYDNDGKIRKYNNVTEIVKEFYLLRIRTYSKRKQHMINKLNTDIQFMDARITFILDVIESRLNIMNVKKQTIEDYLVSNDFPKQTDGYNYLTKMPIHNLTYEKKEQLIKEVNEKKDLLRDIQATDEKTMWLNDIKHFESIYNTDTA